MHSKRWCGAVIVLAVGALAAPGGAAADKGGVPHEGSNGVGRDGVRDSAAPPAGGGASGGAPRSGGARSGGGLGAREARASRQEGAWRRGEAPARRRGREARAH